MGDRQTISEVRKMSELTNYPVKENKEILSR